jgi:hypothetical protein
MPVSARDLFWFAAGLLAALVAGFVLAPLSLSALALRERLRLARWPLVVTAGLIALAIGIYVLSASPNLPSAERAAVHPDSIGAAPIAGAPSTGTNAASSMEAALTRLEQRLAAQGGSDADWELLAQTYDFVGRKADAANARSRHQVAGDARPAAPNPPAPMSPQALAGAAERPAASNAAALPSGPAVSTTAPVQISGEVALDERLRNQVPAGLTLFIVAKSIGSPGAPVAVVRASTGQWPVKFLLDDSLAMLPTRTLSKAGRVTIEARISHSGMATAESGDFQSAVTPVDPSQHKSVRLVIDRVIG